MKRNSWQYFLFILTAIIMIISFLIIFKKCFLKEQFSIEQKYKESNIQKTDHSQKNTSIKNLESLMNNDSWINKKENPLLFSSVRYFSKNNLFINLMEEDAQLYPPIPNHWLLENNLDYSNPNILCEDPDHDGFSNLEEWKGDAPYESAGTKSSDPNNSKSHPLLWTKLKYNKNSLQTMNYSFEFLGIFQRDNVEYFQLQPLTPIPDQNAQKKNILSSRIKYIKIGGKIGKLPLFIDSYHIKKITYKEIDYDVSELVIKNDITNEYWRLTKKSILNPKSPLISIINGVSFDYLLPSPSESISVKRGDDFILKPLKRTFEEVDMETEENESYRLSEIHSKEIIIERNRNFYSIPMNNEL